ncbi:MAG: rRNA maturation RNase YbeY [Nitrospiraceae bacterium]
MPIELRIRLRNKKRVRRRAVMTLAETVLDVVGESRSELGIELVNDRRMRGLNRQYRAKDVSTDVLAFSMRESPGPVSSLLGDVVICIPAVVRQAQASGHSIDKEFTILLIHGILHLCGYDHERGQREARRMHRRERSLLDRVHPLPCLLSRRQ